MLWYAMQPVNFTLRETQDVTRIEIVKHRINSEASISLVIISSVDLSLEDISDLNESASTSLVGVCSADQPMPVDDGSDFKQSANRLTCSYTNPRISKTCLWLQPTKEHACSNLTAASALLWKRITPGLFRTDLNFGASQAIAGKYDFTLHLPLKANGKDTASEYNSIPVKVNVMARICASSSAICFENKDSPGPCSSPSSGIIYTQGEHFQVRVSTFSANRVPSFLCLFARLGSYSDTGFGLLNMRTLMGSGSLHRQLALLLSWHSHCAHLTLRSLGARRTP